MSTGCERWAVRWQDADGDTGTQHFDDRGDADHLYQWMCDDPGIVSASLWEQTMIETTWREAVGLDHPPYKWTTKGQTT